MMRRITDLVLGRKEDALGAPSAPLPHADVLQESESVLQKADRPVYSRILRATAYAVEMAFIAVGVPALTTQLTGTQLLWPGAVIVLGAILLRITKDDLRLRARRWWAEKTRAMYSDLRNIEVKYNQLEANLKRGDQSVKSLSAALSTISEVLRAGLHARTNAEVTSTDGGKSAIVKMDVSAVDLRHELRNLCKVVCEIFDGPGQERLRCGVLVDDPDTADMLMPLVVYDPRDEHYRSEARYSKLTDFSGVVLRRFHEHQRKKDWKGYAHFVVPKVKDLDSTDSSLRAVRLRDHQQEYLRAIAGNVIYCRSQRGDPLVLGVLNIDSNEEDVLTEDKFLALQPYLLPVFRLVANRLLILRSCPSLLRVVAEGGK